MDILLNVLKQISKEESEYETEILVLKDSNFADLNLQISCDNEVIHLRTIESYDLRKENERKKYISDIRYLYQWFNVMIIEERGNKNEYRKQVQQTKFI